MTAENLPAAPATDPDGFYVEETPPPPEVILGRLRRSFPHWAFLHNPGSGEWTACRGKGVVIVRPDALTLRLSLEALHEPTRSGGELR